MRVCVSVFATPVAYNLLSRHAASLRYPVDFTPHSCLVLPCCDITNDCGIFISIINLIYVATAPAAAFIVRIINAPLQLPLPLPTPPSSILWPTPSCESQLSRYWSNLLFLYVSCECVSVYVYVCLLCLTLYVCVCFCGTHFIHYT